MIARHREAVVSDVEDRAGERHRRTIGRILADCLSRITEGRFRRMVTRALRLTARGFVPHDVLVLTELSARLRVEWRSREVHPWDRDLPWERRAARFREQTLHDTATAIARLFRMVPEVDIIEVRVLEPHPSSRMILAGTVVRQDALVALTYPSPSMTLRMMGIRYRVNDGHLEPLE